MILKVLLVIAVIATVYFLFIKKKPTKSKTDKKENLKADDMIECASCGVYAQVSESILSGGKYFCSRECMKSGA